MPHRPALTRKPARADTARANGARYHGPATPDGKARSALNGIAHDLRARSLAPVTAFGDSPEIVQTRLTAYRREFGVPGAYARDLAAALARAALRAVRAAALLQDEAEAAEADLDATLAGPIPNEPGIENVAPEQPLAADPEPANDAVPNEPEPPERSAPHLMAALRVFATGGGSGLDGFGLGMRPGERATVRLGLALLARKARQAGQAPPPLLAAAGRALSVP